VPRFSLSSACSLFITIDSYDLLSPLGGVRQLGRTTRLEQSNDIHGRSKNTDGGCLHETPWRIPQSMIAPVVLVSLLASFDTWMASQECGIVIIPPPPVGGSDNPILDAHRPILQWHWCQCSGRWWSGNNFLWTDGRQLPSPLCMYFCQMIWITTPWFFSFFLPHGVHQNIHFLCKIFTWPESC